MDMNQQMLDIAAAQSESRPNLKFVMCSAERLDAPASEFDHVICQQGFQFFSDKGAAAKEIHRVLQEGGKAIVSVWRPVTECRFFGAICDALIAIDEHEIANAMRTPFDFMPRDELLRSFASAGFSTVAAEKKEMDLLMPGGIEQAIQAVYSTPIGPGLRALPGDSQNRFIEALTARAEHLSGGSTTMGQMAADVLVAGK
jgi:SAM-dependent methyltransferase